MKISGSVRNEPHHITMVCMAQRCRISQGTTVQLQSALPENTSASTDITEYVVFLMQMGLAAPSTEQDATVETGLSLVASEQARFYLDGKRLSATQGLTILSDGLRYVLHAALLQHETRASA